MDASSGAAARTKKILKKREGEGGGNQLVQRQVMMKPYPKTWSGYCTVMHEPARPSSQVQPLWQRARQHRASTMVILLIEPALDAGSGADGRRAGSGKSRGRTSRLCCIRPGVCVALARARLNTAVVRRVRDKHCIVRRGCCQDESDASVVRPGRPQWLLAVICGKEAGCRAP